MKKILKFGLVLVMVLGLAGSSFAATFELEQTFESSSQLKSQGDFLEWTFDLSAYDFTNGTLKLTIWAEDVDSEFNSSTYELNDEDVAVIENTTYLGTLTTAGDTISSWLDLSILGNSVTVRVIMTEEVSDGVTITKSTLTGEYSETPAPVPAPASALLLISGLLAIAGVRKRP